MIWHETILDFSEIVAQFPWREDLIVATFQFYSIQRHHLVPELSSNLNSNLSFDKVCAPQVRRSSSSKTFVIVGYVVQRTYPICKPQKL